MPKITLPLLFLIAPLHGYAAPIIVNPNYQVELFLSDAGAVDGIAIDKSGDLYFTDYAGGRVLKASDMSTMDAGFDVVATGIPYPTDLTVASDGTIYVAASTGFNSPVYGIDAAGNKNVFATGFGHPTSIEYVAGSLFVSNSSTGVISKIDAAGHSTDFVAGGSAPNGPYGISSDDNNNLYFTDHRTGNIYQADLSGNVTLLNSLGVANGATFTAADNKGNLFISDAGSGSIYKMDLHDHGLELFANNFAAKTNAPYIGPTDIAFDNFGSMYVGDGRSIWKLSAINITSPGTALLIFLGLFCLYGKRREF